MKKFIKNCKGAVTVFVTLLLIPAVLLSGTGVDLARIYTAQSILWDANQLAANSALSEYNALLQDLYGLFALTQGDEDLRELVNEYIKTAIYTSDGDQGGVGVLKLFYGSADPETTVDFAVGQNLGNLDVLRRQIEEYTKLRGPVILADEILSRLEQIRKVKADSVVIEMKTDVEDLMNDIDEIYRNIYKSIKNVENYITIESSALEGAYGQLLLIHSQLVDMQFIREEFEEKSKDSDTKDYELDQLIDHYSDVARNITAILLGPDYGLGWEEDLDNPEQGSFTAEIPCGLIKYLRDGDEAAGGNSVTQGIKTLYEQCVSAEKKKEELKKAIALLEKELDKEECSEALRKGLEEPTSDNDRSILDQYKALVGSNSEGVQGYYNLEEMGKQYYDNANNQIKAFRQLMQDLYSGNEPIYRAGERTLYTTEFFKDYNRILTEFDLNYGNDPNHREDKLANALETGPLPIPNPMGGYKNFQETSAEHKEFFNALEELYKNSSDQDTEKDKEKKVKGNIIQMFKTLKELFNQLFVSPDGAWNYSGPLESKIYKTGSDFCGADKDWSSDSKIKKDLKNSLSSDIIDKMGDVANSVANKALLLAYASEMFSCYTTGRGNDTEPKSMAGIPYGIDVNYFYQSELEYIYHGNLTDAKANLDALGSMILLTRFVLNYVVSFSVQSVNGTVELIEASLAFLGPFAFGIGELARLGMALGESLTDLSLLRNGHPIALLKNTESWHFSISGLASLAEKSVEENVKNQVKEAENSGSVLDDTGGLYYADYVRIFLLFVDSQDMAERIANLIALNMTNKMQKIGDVSGENKNAAREAREKAMKEATLFDMSAAVTGFTVTTKVEMDMMFLSMPFAQKGINGVVPPETFTISATDYRGY